MISVELQISLTRLAQAARRYGEVTGKSEAETVAHAAHSFGIILKRGLKAIAPAKGSIRAARMSLLESGSRAKGSGVLVRPAVLRELAAKFQAVTSVATGETFYAMRGGKTGRGKIRGFAREVRDPVSGKMINFTALAVERELNVRESASGFLAYSVPKNPGEVMSRYGFSLSDLTMNVAEAERVKSAMFRWVGAEDEDHTTASAGIQKRALGILSESVEETTADLMVYVNRKLAEQARQFWN